MAHLVSRPKIAVPAALVLAALMALAAATWAGSPARAGGDPGGRLMAKIAPAVRAVPGLEHGRIPWIASSCGACRFPAAYALKIEPRWDSCDGRAGTAGWDPVIIQAGFRWAGGSRALAGLLDERLTARGRARGAGPSWAGGGDVIWISPRGRAPAAEFAIESPVLPGGQWMALVEAKPQGPLVKGC